MVASEDNADDSCRVLSTKAIDNYGIYISHVSFWDYMMRKNINGPRGIYAKRRAKHAKPEIEVTGANQVWAWDITFIKSMTYGERYYLYSLLDIWSRKVVAWNLSEYLNSDEAQLLWDKALIAERLLNVPEKDLPTSLSDRGSQMRSHSTQTFFKKLGIDQLFSRPRTPNDNPQIEALFSTVKNHPDYPGRFSSLETAEEYFDRFFYWYNHEHYHTSLNMITPNDYHLGKAKEILARRHMAKVRTLQQRRQYNLA